MALSTKVDTAIVRVSTKVHLHWLKIAYLQLRWLVAQSIAPEYMIVGFGESPLSSPKPIRSRYYIDFLLDNGYSMDVTP